MRTLMLLIASLLATTALAQQAAFVNAKDLKWKALAQPAGATEAPLWGDATAGDHATVVRWKFNSRARDYVRTQDVHVVVLAGTFTSDVGGDYREFGPGGYIFVPKGVKHTFGCEAAGECRF